MIRGLKHALKAGLRPLVRRLGTPGEALSPSYWGLEYDAGRGLCMDGVVLHDLLATWGSPLHVISSTRLARNVEEFNLPSPRSGRRCEVYYSYKSNPIPGVLRFLHERGAWAEVISPYELWLAFQLGVPPDRIVYNGPAKSDASLREAFERDILLVNANHREELVRLARIAREVGRRPAIWIRVVVPGGWSGQFGIPIAGDEALVAFREARDSGVLDVVAMHVHYGHALRSVEQLRHFVGAILAFADRLAVELGIELKILDFGGSLVIPSVAPLTSRDRSLNWKFHRPISPPVVSTSLTIASYTTSLLEQVESHYAARGVAVPRIFVEPGRALTGNSQLLLTSVITTNASQEGLTFAIMDAGINLAEAARNEYHQIFPVNRHGEAAAGVYCLAGPICSPGDVLYPAVALPALQPGDSLAIMDAGAYFVPFSTSFSFPRPAIVMVEAGRTTLLRRRESFDDLIAFDVPSG